MNQSLRLLKEELQKEGHFQVADLIDPDFVLPPSPAARKEMLRALSHAAWLLARRFTEKHSRPASYLVIAGLGELAENLRKTGSAEAKEHAFLLNKAQIALGKELMKKESIFSETKPRQGLGDLVKKTSKLISESLMSDSEKEALVLAATLYWVVMGREI